MAKSDDDELETLQAALVRYQVDAIAQGHRDLVVFEGRDTAGKDGAIKRINEHLSVRNTRIVALPKPTDRERSQWYFQRYVAHLPAAGELVILNRSWYNRGGVEPVMGFCTPEQNAAFLDETPVFERMLIGDGVRVVKLWLDISRKEQAAVAQEKWDDYSRARDEMLSRTHSAESPWVIVHTDKKAKARTAIMRHLLHALAPAEVAKDVPKPDPDVLYTFDTAALSDGRLER